MKIVVFFFFWRILRTHRINKKWRSGNRQDLGYFWRDRIQRPPQSPRAGCRRPGHQCWKEIESSISLILVPRFKYQEENMQLHTVLGVWATSPLKTMPESCLPHYIQEEEGMSQEKMMYFQKEIDTTQPETRNGQDSCSTSKLLMMLFLPMRAFRSDYTPACTLPWSTQ